LGAGEGEREGDFELRRRKLPPRGDLDLARLPVERAGDARRPGLDRRRGGVTDRSPGRRATRLEDLERDLEEDGSLDGERVGDRPLRRSKSFLVPPRRSLGTYTSRRGPRKGARSWSLKSRPPRGGERDLDRSRPRKPPRRPSKPRSPRLLPPKYESVRPPPRRRSASSRRRRASSSAFSASSWVKLAGRFLRHGAVGDTPSPLSARSSSPRGARVVCPARWPAR